MLLTPEPQPVEFELKTTGFLFSIWLALVYLTKLPNPSRISLPTEFSPRGACATWYMAHQLAQPSWQFEMKTLKVGWSRVRGAIDIRPGVELPQLWALERQDLGQGPAMKSSSCPLKVTRAVV